MIAGPGFKINLRLTAAWRGRRRQGLEDRRRVRPAGRQAAARRTCSSVRLNRPGRCTPATRPGLPPGATRSATCFRVAGPERDARVLLQRRRGPGSRRSPRRCRRACAARSQAIPGWQVGWQRLHRDVATDFAARRTVRADDRDSPPRAMPATWTRIIRQFAVAYLHLAGPRPAGPGRALRTAASRVSLLYADGRVGGPLPPAGRDPGRPPGRRRCWLRTDRLRRQGPRDAKSDGSYTYFLPDVAYHLARRARRGRAGDQHPGRRPPGTVARVRAGVQAAGMGDAGGLPELRAAQMVTVMKGGQEVKYLQTRGQLCHAARPIDWTGRDAVRFHAQPQGPPVRVRRRPRREAERRGTPSSTSSTPMRGSARCSRSGAATSDAWPAPTSLAHTAPSEAALMLALAEFPPLVAGGCRAGAARGRVPGAVWRRRCTPTRPSASSSTTGAGVGPAGAARGDALRCCATAWRCSV